MSMYLTAAEAAARLGVSRATLYAYVSRGLVRSQPTPGRRDRRYAVADIEALVQRKKARRDPTSTASQALGIRGLPVLESALSSIDGGVLRYRGHEVTALSRSARLEEVAELLWGHAFDPRPATTIPAAVRRAIAGMPLIPAMHMWLATTGAHDAAALNLAPVAVARTGSTIACGLASVAASGEVHDDIATTLARGWGITSKADIDRISAALVLCADHELNVSAFTARCVASARGTPYMVVTAALAALQGHRHGGETERFAAMLDEPGSPATILEARLRRGDHVPGFGHPLYPDGDPRAATLLARRGRGKGSARIEAFIAAGHRLLGAEPTLDLGLVALCRALRLPADAPLALFAVGRLVGWVAHAIEQYASEPTIRPRARYVGPGPVEPEPRGGDLR